MSAEQAEQQAEKQRAQEDQRAMMLHAVMTVEARARRAWRFLRRQLLLSRGAATAVPAAARTSHLPSSSRLPSLPPCLLPSPSQRRHPKPSPSPLTLPFSPKTLPEPSSAVARIALVKPDKARAVENSVLAAAQRGQIQEKVTEERLVAMLESMAEREAGSRKVTITRRRPAFSDDDE